MINLNKVKEVTYNTEQVLLFAFAAYRRNKGEYIKDTRRFSEDTPTQFSNKDLVRFAVMKELGSPDDLIQLEITQQDKDSLEDARKHMRRYTLLALGDLNEFTSNMFEAYSQDESNSRSLGILAYFPAFVEKDLKNNIYKKRLRNEFKDSKYISEEIVNKQVEILKTIPLANGFFEPTNMYFGSVDGNLVCFTKKDILKTYNFYSLRAKIKGQDTERETGLKMTRLNYVKLKEIK